MFNHCFNGLMIPNDFRVWMFKGGSPNHQGKTLRIFGLNSFFGPFWCSDWLRHPVFCFLKFFHAQLRERNIILSFTNETYRDTLPVSPTGPSEEIMGSAVWSMGDLRGTDCISFWPIFLVNFREYPHNSAKNAWY